MTSPQSRRHQHMRTYEASMGVNTDVSSLTASVCTPCFGLLPLPLPPPPPLHLESLSAALTPGLVAANETWRGDTDSTAAPSPTLSGASFPALPTVPWSTWARTELTGVDGGGASASARGAPACGLPDVAALPASAIASNPTTIWTAVRTAVLCCAVLCCAVLCCAVLRCAVHSARISVCLVQCVNTSLCSHDAFAKAACS